MIYFKIYESTISIIAAPLLFPIYFQSMTVRHAYTRQKWMVSIRTETIDIFFLKKYIYKFRTYFGCLYSILNSCY